VASVLNASFEITIIVQGPSVLHPCMSCCIGQFAYFPFLLFYYGFLNYTSFSGRELLLVFLIDHKLSAAMQAIFFIHD